MFLVLFTDFSVFLLWRVRGKRKMRKICWWGKHEGRISLERTKRKWKYNIKIILE
jgi:hypothetical protein